MEAWLASIPDLVVIVLFAVAGIIAWNAVEAALPGRRILDPPGDGGPEMIALLDGLQLLAVAGLVLGVAAGAAFDSASVFWAATVISVEELYLSAMLTVVVRATFDRDTTWRQWFARPLHGVGPSVAGRPHKRPLGPKE